MTGRILVLVSGFALALAIVPADAGVGAQAPGSASQVMRTPWGDPDIQGLFTTDDELGVPFERPEQFGDRAVVSEEEFADRQKQSVRQAEMDSEENILSGAAEQAAGASTGR